jgi:bis(5'-nucleosidyl)-tetraphosphatase
MKRVSAGIIPILRSKTSGPPKVLLLRAYNYWDFPKGNVEQGEDPLEAAIRELEEETAISKVNFLWGKEFRETVPYSSGKIARYYVAAVDSQKVALEPNVELGRPEHHEYRWVEKEEALKLLSPRVHEILDWALDLVFEK